MKKKIKKQQRRIRKKLHGRREEKTRQLGI